jgi:hypothetical protein
MQNRIDLTRPEARKIELTEDENSKVVLEYYVDYAVTHFLTYVRHCDGGLATLHSLNTIPDATLVAILQAKGWTVTRA